MYLQSRLELVRHNKKNFPACKLIPIWQHKIVHVCSCLCNITHQSHCDLRMLLWGKDHHWLIFFCPLSAVFMDLIFLCEQLFLLTYGQNAYSWLGLLTSLILYILHCFLWGSTDSLTTVYNQCLFSSSWEHLLSFCIALWNNSHKSTVFGIPHFLFDVIFPCMNPIYSLATALKPLSDELITLIIWSQCSFLHMDATWQLTVTGSVAAMRGVLGQVASRWLSGPRVSQ